MEQRRRSAPPPRDVRTFLPSPAAAEWFRPPVCTACGGGLLHELYWFELRSTSYGDQRLCLCCTATFLKRHARNHQAAGAILDAMWEVDAP
jgi:hypothetical protein